MPKVWFTSDTHFGHAASIKYCDRPFGSVEEMNEALIQNWTQRVQKGDRVYHLGDFAFCDPGPILDRLPGQLFLVAGNHDQSKTLKHPRWIKVAPYKEIRVGGHKIVLSHYAFETWNQAHHGAWHLHGHSHGNLPHRGKRMDVGVDCTDYAPASFEAVSDVMATREFVAVDHHR